MVIPSSNRITSLMGAEMLFYATTAISLAWVPRMKLAHDEQLSSLGLNHFYRDLIQLQMELPVSVCKRVGKKGEDEFFLGRFFSITNLLKSVYISNPHV